MSARVRVRKPSREERWGGYWLVERLQLSGDGREERWAPHWVEFEWRRAVDHAVAIAGDRW